MVALWGGRRLCGWVATEAPLWTDGRAVYSRSSPTLHRALLLASLTLAPVASGTLSPPGAGSFLLYRSSVAVVPLPACNVCMYAVVGVSCGAHCRAGNPSFQLYPPWLVLIRTLGAALPTVLTSFLWWWWWCSPPPDTQTAAHLSDIEFTILGGKACARRSLSHLLGPWLCSFLAAFRILCASSAQSGPPTY